MRIMIFDPFYLSFGVKWQKTRRIPYGQWDSNLKFTLEFRLKRELKQSLMGHNVTGCICPEFSGRYGERSNHFSSVHSKFEPNWEQICHSDRNKKTNSNGVRIAVVIVPYAEFKRSVIGVRRLYKFFQLEFSFLSKLFQHKFMRRPFTKASDNWTTCHTVEWSRQFSKFFGIHISISNGTFCSNSPLSMDKRIIKCLPKYRSLFVVCA